MTGGKRVFGKRHTVAHSGSTSAFLLPQLLTSSVNFAPVLDNMPRPVAHLMLLVTDALPEQVNSDILVE